jgi:hypothetical protein
MGRFFIGTLSPGSSVRFGIIVTNPFNPSGDWRNSYELAHPRNPSAELVSTSHSKVLTTSGRFAYFVTVTNIGPFATLFDVDF